LRSQRPGRRVAGCIDPALAAACVPVSIFGNAPLTQAQHNYLFGNLDEVLDYTQQVAAINAPEICSPASAQADTGRGRLRASYRVGTQSREWRGRRT